MNRCWPCFKILPLRHQHTEVGHAQLRMSMSTTRKQAFHFNSICQLGLVVLKFFQSFCNENPNDATAHLGFAQTCRFKPMKTGKWGHEGWNHTRSVNVPKVNWGHKCRGKGFQFDQLSHQRQLKEHSNLSWLTVLGRVLVSRVWRLSDNICCLLWSQWQQAKRWGPFWEGGFEGVCGRLFQTKLNPDEGIHCSCTGWDGATGNSGETLSTLAHCCCDTLYICSKPYSRQSQDSFIPSLQSHRS